MNCKDRIQCALLALENGKFKSVSAAAQFHDVPRATLSY